MLTKVIGFVLIGLGVIGLVYGGVKYTMRETVLEVGPVEIAADREKSLPIPPIAGGVLVGVGVLLLVVGGRKQ